MARIKGAVGLRTLKRMAKESDEPVIYYVVQRRSLKIVKFFINSKGLAYRGDGASVSFAKHEVKRFLNYWHAHAHSCQLHLLRNEEQQDD